MALLNCSMWYSSQKIRNTRTSSRAASAAAWCVDRMGSDKSSVGSPVASTSLKEVISWSSPFSRSSKSSAVSVRTGMPLRSITLTSTRTSSVPVRNTGGRCSSDCSPVCCPWIAAVRRPIANTAARGKRRVMALAGS
jgi:hypothetical protein